MACAGCTGMKDAPKEKGRAVEDAAAKVTLDLYVSSLCRYGMNAELAMIKVKELFGESVELNIRFIERIDETGAMSSMFGEDGLSQDIRQMCIMKLYPDKYFEYLKLFNTEGDRLTFD